jgi:hypothetical protein
MGSVDRVARNAETPTKRRNFSIASIAVLTSASSDKNAWRSGSGKSGGRFSAISARKARVTDIATFLNELLF